MIDHLLAGLRQRGILERMDHLVLRIGLNALDRLESVGDQPVRLPKFMGGVLGPELPAARLAREWRRAAAEARTTLAALVRLEVGQHVPAMKLVAAAAGSRDVEAEAAHDPKLARFLARPATQDLLPHLRALGAELPGSVASLLDDLLGRRSALLAERRRQREQTLAAVQHELADLDTHVLVLYAALVRRLWQRAESLPYLNDRPYSLALYLLFGPTFFHALVDRASFSFEYVVERQRDLCPGCLRD
jgi:hypothetical protein